MATPDEVPIRSAPAASSARSVDGSEVGRQGCYTAHDSRGHDDQGGEREGGLDGDRAGVVKHLH